MSIEAARVTVPVVLDSRRVPGQAAAAGQTAARGMSQRFASGLRSGAVAAARAGAVLATGAAVGIVRYSKTAVAAASEQSEAVNKTRVLFDDSARGVLRWSKTTADALGTSRSQALEAAGGFGAMFDTAGLVEKSSAKMSRRMVGLAGDMASFNNEDPSEMLERLRSGLAGEAEPLRRFGVFISAATVAEQAYKDGIAERGAELTEQQKVQARYNLILSQTGRQQGDFARTSEGLANQQRRLGAVWEDISAKAGRKLLPIVQKVMGALLDRAPQLERFAVQGIGALGSGIDRAGQLWEQHGPRIVGIVGDLMGRLGDIDVGRVFDRLSDAASGLFDTLSDPRVGAAVASIAGSAGSLFRKLGPDIASTVTSTQKLVPTLNLGAKAFRFVADHADKLKFVLPVLAAGFVAVKLGQVAAHLAAVVNIPLRIFEIGVNRELIRSNRALMLSRKGETAAMGVNTIAQGTARTGRIKSLFLLGKEKVALVGSKLAHYAAAGAAKAMAFAQRALNLVLRANPIGLVITVLAGVAAALVFAYKRSETFRRIVDKAWQVVQSAVRVAWQDFIRPALTALADQLQRVWRIAGQWRSNVVEAFRGAKEGVTRILGGLRDGVSNIWESITSAMRGGVNRAIGVLNGFIQGANKILAKLPGDLQISLIPTLAAPRTVGNAIGPRPGVGGAFASGGMVRGPGGPRDDLIDARLSNGEFVWSADAARRFGPRRLEQLHAHFAANPSARREAESGGPSGGVGLRELIYAGSPWWILSGQRVARRAGSALDAIHRNHVHVGGSPLANLAALMRGSGIAHRLTSGYRPGDGGLHGQGLAADFAGPVPSASPSPEMDRIFGFWASQVGANFTGGGGQGAGGMFGWLRERVAALAERAAGPMMAALGRVAPGGILGDLVTGGARSIVDKILDFIRASGGAGVLPGTGGSVAGNLSATARQFGWASAPAYTALLELLRRESGGNPTAQNPTSSAYGRWQFLDSTWATVGGRKTSNPNLQDLYGLRYISQRYSNPMAALAFHDRNNWYDQGGFLPPGTSIAHNGTGRPEIVAPEDAITRAVQRGNGGGGIHIDTLRAGMDRGDVVRELERLQRRERLHAAGRV